MKRLLATLAFVATTAMAQCIMCQRTASAQQVERAKVLNYGILVIMVPVLSIVTGFGFLVYRRRNVCGRITEPTHAVDNGLSESTPGRS